MKWSYIIFSYLSLFALGFSDNLRGPIFLDVLETFGLDHTQGSWMFTLSALMGALGALFIRKVLTRLRPLAAVQLSLLLMSVGLLGMGGASSFALFLVFSGVLGLSMGFLGVLQNLLVSVGSHEHKRQQMLSGLHSVYGLSSLSAPMAVSLINSFTQSWRWSCYIVVLIPFSVLVSSFLHRIKETHGLSDQSFSEQKISPDEKRWMIFLAFTFGFYVSSEILVATRVASFFRMTQSFSFSEASTMLTWFFLALFIGRIMSTFIQINRSLYTKLTLSLGLSSLTLIVGLLTNPIIIVLSGFTMAPFFAWAVAYVSEKFRNHEKMALAYLISIQSFLIVLAHFFIGYLTDAVGIRSALFVAPSMLALSAVMLFYFDRMQRVR